VVVCTKLAGIGLNVSMLERLRAILEDGCHITQLSGKGIVEIL